MTANAPLPRDEQYRLVYNGIAAVASNCDGAVSEDGVGFNGQDTKFGKRIASVPFEAWTEDVKEEAARIALTYKQQILAYTGIDMFELEVVKEATGHSTNRQARDDARDFERRAFHVTVSDDGTALEFRFKYSAVLVDELKRHTMGARWQPAEKFWMVPVAKQLPGFVTWAKDPGLKFRFSPEALAALDQILTATPEQVRAVAEAKPVVHGYIVNSDVVFSFPYNPGQKDAIKAAGARWNGADKTWRVALSNPKAAAVVAAARAVGLTVAKEVDVALGGAQKAAAASFDKKTVLLAASRVSRPAELSPEFEQLVAQAVAR